MVLIGLAWLIVGWTGVSSAPDQTFNVFAAASLKESAVEIAHKFEEKHRSCTVSLNFGGSQQLVAQIKQGAQVDVLLSAGMEALKSLDYIKGSLRIFAYNKLALIVPAGSKKIRTLRDLSRNIRVIVADSHVPVGNYTEQMLTKAQGDYGKAWKAKVESEVVSKEQDVRAVLAKVGLGEADAGIVYVTDVGTAKGNVRMIDIPALYNVRAQYPAVLFSSSVNPDMAKEFMEFLLAPDGQKVLVKHGFVSPFSP